MMFIRRSVSIAVVALVAGALGMFTFAAPISQQTGTWRLLGSLVDARQGASATMLDDGRVLVAGGTNASGVLASAEIVSADGSTIAVPPMNVARSGHTATKLADGRVLVAGGTDANSEATASAELFYPASGVWVPVSMTAARRNHTATLVTGESGLVVVAGGENSGGVLASIEVFDPDANAFAPMSATLSSARTRHAAAALTEGLVLVAGGSTSSSVLASTDIINVPSGTVTAGPSMTDARKDFTATALLNGDILVAGGVGGSNGTTELGSAEKFVTSLGAFVTVGGLPGPRHSHQAVRLPSNAGVLVVGGIAFEQPLRSVDLFLPESQVFRMTSPTEIFHTSGVLAPAGTGLALSAGGVGTSALETYAFATVTTDTDDYAPGETVYMTGTGWTPNEPVTLVLREVGDLHPPRTFTALANGQGVFENAEFSPEEHHLGVRFYLTATQGASEAQHTFTDAANKATFSTTAGGAEISSLAATPTGTCVTAFLQARQGAVNLDTVFSPRTATLSATPSTGATFYPTSGCTGSPNPSVEILADQSAVVFSFVVTTATTTAYTIKGDASWANTQNDASATITINADSTAPTVSSINRLNASPTNANSVTWQVTFSENVTGVDAGDFSLAMMSGVTGASITNVTGANTTWTVTADTGNGSGSLRLDLLDDDTIVDATANKLGGTGASNGDFIGQVYTIDRTLTPTFTADNKQYDGNASATILTRSFTSALPTAGFDLEVTGGTATFDNKNVGTGKTITGTGFVLGGNDAGRFLLSSASATTTANITTANANCSVTGYDVTYDGNSHTATGACLGVEGETLTGLDLSGTTHTIAGSYPADPWTFTDATGNYNNTSGTVADEIGKASSTTTVTCSAGPHVYTGSAITPCSVSVTGAGGLNLTPTPTYANNTGAGTATASYTFDGDDNHTGSADSEDFTIDKASSTTTVTCTAGPFVYNGSPYTPCSVSVTGAGGLNLTPTPDYSDNTDAGTATASYTFDGDDNHIGSSDSEDFTIDKAESTTSVTCTAGPHVYTGSPITPCSVSVTGAGGLNLTPTPDYANNTNAGPATASYTFAGDDNHTGSSDSEGFTIDKAPSTTTVTCPASVVYTGLAQEPCSASVSGAGGLSQSLTVTYLNNEDVGTATANASYGGDSNHLTSSDSQTFEITKASLTIAAVNRTKTLGATMTPDQSFPSDDFTVTGLLSGDSVATVTMTSAGYAAAATVGPHTITPSNATGTGLANYNITYTPATLSVQYAFGACQVGPGRTILEPINPNGSSVFKQKSTVPVKFNVCDVNGNLVGTPGVVTSFLMIAQVNGTNSDPNEAPDSTTPDTTFRWTGSHWIFNVSTKSMSAGKTYVFRIALNDGTFIDFQFGLK